jgi:hypothetical protein
MQAEATGLGVGANIESIDWSHASPASKRFRVTVNRQPVFVGDFWSEHFAQFFFKDRANVEVEFLEGDINSALTALSPKSLGIPYEIEGNRLRFTIEKPKQYVLRINEPNRPGVSLGYLLLFAETSKDDSPSPGENGVIDVLEAGIDHTGKRDITRPLARLISKAKAGSTLYFPRGTYLVEDLRVRRDNITLYLAPGAFIHSQKKGHRRDRKRAISVSNAANVSIRGFGLIEANGYALTVEKAPDFLVEDMMIRSDAIGKRGVTPHDEEDGGRGLILSHSDRYRLINVKILTIIDQAIGKGKDALNLASSSDGFVGNSFSISGDDTFTIKGRHDIHEWLTVDLGQEFRLNKIAVKWGSAHFQKYRLDSSVDGVKWTTLAKIDQADSISKTLRVRGKARWVRIRSLERLESYWAGDLLREIEVYSAAHPGKNLALNRPAKSSPYGHTYPGHEPDKAVDGDERTSWANEYRSRRVLFRDNVALVTANPIKIGTGAEYAGDDITWENHDVVDAGYYNGPGSWGSGMMNFSHYDFGRVPHQMAMKAIRVRNARFEDTVGFLEVGWSFGRPKEYLYFATELDAVFENVTVDHVYPGKTSFAIFADPITAVIRLKFINLKVAGSYISSFEDLLALGVVVDLRNLNADDRIEFMVTPDNSYSEQPRLNQ